MTPKSIGRRVLLKYTAASALGILLLVTGAVLIVGRDSDVPITLERVFETYTNELADNAGFVTIQCLLILALIWYVGGICGQMIIEQKGNRFVIGALGIFALWAGLFMGCCITAGLMNSIQYSGSGFRSAIVSWMVYGLIPFIVFGLIHGLVIGFPLGYEIKSGGEKLETEQ